MNNKSKGDPTQTGMGTKAVWSGEKYNQFQKGTLVPVNLGVAFGYRDADEWYAVATGKRKGHIYGRNTNPTVAVLEEKIRILENAEAATSFSTGMAAISNTLYSLLKSGDRVVSIKDSYGGTSKIFLDHLPQLGMEVRLCKTEDHSEIEKEITRGCKLLYLETPTNPTLKVLDIQGLSEKAKSRNAWVVVDSTMATPVNQNPLDLGADLVIHSATKFLCGHADALGGLVCGSSELIDKIFHYREINGASLDPMSAYLILRGMKTLELRINRQNENALKIAEFLQSQQAVDNVYYPGLPSHPNHQIAQKQMRGFGGVLSFSLKGDYETVKRFLPELKLAHLAAHLGSVETFAGPPRTTSHVETSPEEREMLGIPENLIRYSVGIENAEDLIGDLEQGLEKIMKACL